MIKTFFGLITKLFPFIFSYLLLLYSYKISLNWHFNFANECENDAYISAKLYLHEIKLVEMFN